MLADFTRLQIDLSQYASKFFVTGMPDLRLSKLGDAYKEILASKDRLFNGSQESLSDNEYKKFSNTQNLIESMIEELNTYPIPNSIEHGDLRDGNVFINDGHMTFFDWGDTSLSHTFISLMIPLRVLGNYLGLEPENHRDLLLARCAYLEPWTDFMSLDSLYEAWYLAFHIGCLHQSILWYKFAENSRRRNNFDHEPHFSGWVRKFIHHPVIPTLKEMKDAK